ncbi:MAG: sulfur oxidation c-type cytochrome SoxX [Ramlibacter sp.]|nr:sulfur oxidation c-type cytochrome SoxX [Ramlibacter sp.]
MKKTPITIAATLVAATIVTACATGGAPSAANVEKLADSMVKSAFRAEGIATTDRVTAIDETLKECNAADAAGKPLDPAVAKRLEAANLKTVKWPSDGKFLGDWKAGEKLAQSGRGMTWTDKSTKTADNGGNCYNCHQIAKEEISFGTIGPSLYNYGKMRGVSDPNSAAAKPIVEYTWGKIWNAKAYNACSNMPRAGHAGILDEQQIRNIVALLLDPQSPVNK